jgi:N-acetyl-beta-hexosaminidase
MVNVYQALETATTTLKRGLKTTVSMAQNHWYLDMQTCGGYYQNAWKCVYNVDPGTAAAGLPEEQASLLLGGETAMWGEGVNKDNFDAFVWRNTAAAAERLWSPLSQTQQAVDITMHRLNTHACKMSKRGVAVGAADRGYCPTDALDFVGHDSRSELEALRAENARLREQLRSSLLV